MVSVSAVIITLNEENNIERCISSLSGLADEILVVDSGSDDRTVEICKGLGARVVINSFPGYKEQKNYALEAASNDWVLSVDGDEALSDELRASIATIKNGPELDGYYFNRRNNYCGQWIKFSNWYPDRKLRFFNRKQGRWGGINPHDRVVMNEGTKTGFIEGDLLHWVISTHEEHLEKVERFSSIAAGEYFKMGYKISIAGIFIHTFWRFIKAYFIKLGLLDGYNGFIISALSAKTSYKKYIKLRRLYKKDHTDTRNN